MRAATDLTQDGHAAQVPLDNLEQTCEDAPHAE